MCAHKPHHVLCQSVGARLGRLGRLGRMGRRRVGGGRSGTRALKLGWQGEGVGDGDGIINGVPSDVREIRLENKHGVGCALANRGKRGGKTCMGMNNGGSIQVINEIVWAQMNDKCNSFTLDGSGGFGVSAESTRLLL